MAKQRKNQQQENKDSKESGPPSTRNDDELSEKIIQLDEDPSSPLKSRMTEITMYPTLPKAQSHPNHPFKDRRRVSISENTFDVLHAGYFPQDYSKISLHTYKDIDTTPFLSPSS